MDRLSRHALFRPWGGVMRSYVLGIGWALPVLFYPATRRAGSRNALLESKAKLTIYRVRGTKNRLLRITLGCAYLSATAVVNLCVLVNGRE